MFCDTGFLLLARVISVTFCMTLGASLAAHHGPTPMAAFQICLQLWLATSLLADGLAVAGQVLQNFPSHNTISYTYWCDLYRGSMGFMMCCSLPPLFVFPGICKHSIKH